VLTTDPKTIEFESLGLTAEEDRDSGDRVHHVIRKGRTRVGTAEVPAGTLTVRCQALGRKIAKL
jgi:hypothetical protein